MRRLVIFDLDGTLIDSRDDIASAANAARAKLGLTPLPAETVQSYVGDGARNLMVRALGPGHEARLDEAMDAFFNHYGENLIVATRLYAGIDALLANLDAALTVLTNKPGRFARPICEKLAIADRFEVVWGEGDVPARKPDPRGVLELCSRFGVSPSEARFVGDSRVDAAAARNAAIPFIGVTWGYGTEAQMRAAGGERFVRDSAELLRSLQE